MKDLTGQRFGRLIAVKPTEERRGSCVVWECRCDCGNTALVSSSNLCGEQTKSCGCLRKEWGTRLGKYSPGKEKSNLIGKRFGRLVALRPTEERRDHSVVWECKCDCGNTAFVKSISLTSGRNTACGSKKQGGTKCEGEYAENDMPGRRFGRITVIVRSDRRKGEALLWKCKCDCGKTTYAVGYQLKRGLVQSCGCLQKERRTERSKKSLIDLTGRRFGRLTVVEVTEERRNKAVVWECKCDCGKTTFVTGNNLKSGSTRSCGCLRIKNNSNYN